MTEDTWLELGKRLLELMHVDQPLHDAVVRAINAQASLIEERAAVMQQKKLKL